MDRDERFMDDLFDDINRSDWEERLTRMAFNNTYRVAIGEITLGELMDSNDPEIALMFNPQDVIYGNKEELVPGITRAMLEEMIEYFIETEEYEKCAKLQKILDGRCSSREPTEISKNSTAWKPPRE